MKNDITVIINTFNEEAHIKECITSAKLLTTSIVIVDMESTDRTAHIAKQQQTQFYSYPFSHYVEPAREFGIRKATTDWVFILDADERMTTQLAEEIHKKISEETNSYYKVPRKNIFGRAKWLKHGGWWPDHQMRLLNKKFLKLWPKEIHSTPKMDGDMGFLTSAFLHYFHGDLEKMVEKTIVFEGIESSLLFNANKPVSTATFFRKFLGELNRRLIKRMGFLDGEIGIIESVYQAFSKTITYLFLYEKKKSGSI